VDARNLLRRSIQNITKRKKNGIGALEMCSGKVLEGENRRDGLPQIVDSQGKGVLQGGGEEMPISKKKGPQKHYWKYRKRGLLNSQEDQNRRKNHDSHALL